MNFWVDSKSFENDVIKIQSRSMPDTPFSDFDIKNKMRVPLKILN